MAMLPKAAATIILLREGKRGPEVLMLQRTQSAAFLGGAYVFPGGSLESQDSDPRIVRRVGGITSEQADRRLNVPSNGIAYWVAAVRECFEEAGILLLCDKTGLEIEPYRAGSLLHYRRRSFRELLESEDLYIPGDAIAYCGHWITAPGRSRRFDTRFFVALAPTGQIGANDAQETVHDVWISPQEALERAERGEIELVFATQHTLRDFARFGDPRHALEYARNLPEVEVNRACWAKGAEGPKLFRRADPAYFEIHWCDPEESGESTYDLAPGVPKKLDRFVTRLIAPNPGAMTGPGTNTYIVGNREVAVLDPGPAIDSHVEKILAETKGRLRWIVCTHTHMDHSPAAALLKKATGAPVLGRAAPAGQDATFVPDRTLSHNDRLIFDGVTLRVIHTPGHASNHLCYFLEETKMLFTGDHVMQGSTVVINPPDGDMRAYLASLEMLLTEDMAIIAPGHGYLIGTPHKEIRRLIAHRMAREDKVRSALRRLRSASVDDLLPLVYDDVPERMHRWAARSLTAHVEKLVADGAVRSEGSRYALVESAR